MYRVTNVMDNMSILSTLTVALTFCIRGFSHGRKRETRAVSFCLRATPLILTEPGPRHLEYNYNYTLIVAQSSAGFTEDARMALFLLRSSYRMLMAVCFLLGVNVFTFYVLSQGGGLSLGEM